MKHFFFTCLLAFTIFSAGAQSKFTGQTIALKFGATSSYADIRAYNYYRTINLKNKNLNEVSPFFGANYQYMFSNIFGLYADANIGTVKGVMTNRNRKSVKGYPATEDYNLYQRLGYSVPIYSKTKFVDGSIGVYLNLSNLGMHLVMANNKNAKPRKWGLYTYGGLGYTAYDSEVFSIFSVNSAKLNADKKYLHGYISKKEDRNKYKTFDVQYTAGLGVKYKLNDMIDLSLDYCVHFVNSDKFDATVDLINPAAQNISNTLLIAANKFATGNNDKFGLIGVKVGYKIGSNNPANYNIEWNDPQEMILKKVDADAAKLKSLLNDSDKDGVSDAFDKEPNTPSGVKVDGSGMALDIDYDGVPDFKDDELYSAKGSTVNETGVASDSDGDGVADVKDMEPNSASNALVNFRGVTIGKRDETTTTTTTTNTTSQTFIFPSIYFDLNATVVKSIYHDQLADVARILIKYPNLKISIFGNADQRGNDMFNENLGKSRAEAVGNYLKNNFKIDASRIIAVNSYGKSKPISNLHAPNRRVDILSNEQF